MKMLLLILLGCSMMKGKASAAENIDTAMAKEAEVVLRVRNLGCPGGFDKYGWYNFEVFEVLKNDSKETFGKNMKVAVSNLSPMLPAGEFTVYLERYNKIYEKRWKLVGGEMATGVSHIQKPEAQQGGADQPATAPELKSEGKDKPQPESKVRPR